MSANTDILLGYFDSLLAPCPQEESGIHPLDSLLAEAIAPFAAQADTVAAGYRMIPLMTPHTPMSVAAVMTMNLELLSVIRRLDNSRLKRSMLAACRPEGAYG